MCSAKDRIKTYLKGSIEEIDLIEKMSAGIKSPRLVHVVS